MLGVIGGSGFESFSEFNTVALLPRETPFGLASSGFKKVKVKDHEFLFISRHGERHEHLPSEINFRANIYALKQQGAKAIVSFSAVGSLVHECAPGDLVIPHQYIDRTKGVRAHTFLGEGLVGHVSLADPVCPVVAKKAAQLLKNNKPAKGDFKIHEGQTHLVVDGPYFSTRAESLTYRAAGAHILGMTNFPEYALAREAGLPYLPCSFVTDYDCWDESIPHVTAEEVMRVMKLNNGKAFHVLSTLLHAGPIWEGSLAPKGGLVTGLFMKREDIPAEKRQLVEVLLGN
jgi:5'-methylthioadenosine phosphorylase